MNKLFLAIIASTNILLAIEDIKIDQEQNPMIATVKSGVLHTMYETFIGIPLKMAEGARDHFIEHGEGLEAKRQLLAQNQFLAKQNETIKELSSQQDNTAIIESINKTAQATEKVAGSVDQMKDKINEGIETVNKKSTIQEKALVLSIFSGSIYILKSGYDFTKFLYNWMYPTNESLLREQEVIKQIKYNNARTAFFECLGRNRKDSMNEEGLPRNCQEASRLFFEAAGPVEFDQVRLAFMKR